MTEKREINDFTPLKPKEDLPQKKVGCAECGGTGWITIEQPHGQPLAKKCECYEKYLEERDKPQWGKK